MLGALMPLSRVAAAPETALVAGPADFVVKADGADIQALELSWSPVAGSEVSYKLERSTDRQQWLPVGSYIKEVRYRDSGLAPDVRYYYRLSALDVDGRPSEFTYADGNTGQILGVAVAATQEFTSGDKIATAMVKTTDMPQKVAVCVVVTTGQRAPRGEVMAAGTYSLECRESDGRLISDWRAEVTWKLQLKERMAGLSKPEARDFAAGGKAQVVESDYDQTTGEMTVAVPATAKLAVVAPEPNMVWVNLIIAGGLGLMGLLPLSLIPARRARRQNYREYLRSKYYNL